MADEALLDSLDIRWSGICAAAEASIDAIYDLSLGQLLSNDITAGRDGLDGVGSEFDLGEVARDGYDIGDGQVLAIDRDCVVFCCRQSLALVKDHLGERAGRSHDGGSGNLQDAYRVWALVC